MAGVLVCRSSEVDMEVLRTIKDHLLQGLADDSETIRYKQKLLFVQVCLSVSVYWSVQSCIFLVSSVHRS